MRRIAGVALALVGLCVLVLGAALAVVVGPDNRVSTSAHRIDAKGVAVVTAPDAIAWTDATVTIDVQVPERKPVFLGVGNSVDVEDYLSDTRALRIDSVDVPWDIETSEQSGKAWLPASPLAIDWWTEQASGMGGAALDLDLTDETVSIAVLAVGANDLSGLKVTGSYYVRGGFAIGLGMAAIGLGLILTAIVVWRGRRGPHVVDANGYVYVYVDPDGNETLVPLDELEEYEIVDVTGDKHEPS
ncbi:hypothetical protein MU582_15485 [Nocardioidaceae bacterium SCSIO 66511]|nr:hypothetical protein MU582_15485 [Nocardioidaceae bacterium SCSIO 66511]